MIITRYLISEIIKLLLFSVVLLVGIFSSYSVVMVANATAGESQHWATIIKLVSLNVFVCLEVLLPTALYFSIIFGVGRLYEHAEILALNALGVSEARILVPVLMLSLGVALLVGVLSIYVRPWAYKMSYKLENEIASELSVGLLQPGHFNVLGKGRFVVTAERNDAQNNRLYGVFVQGDSPQGKRFIYAREAHIEPANGKSVPKIVFLNGYAYEFLHERSAADRILKFKQLILPVSVSRSDEVRNKRKAESTLELAQSSEPKKIAEFQWRISTPVLTLLMALLAVPLSRRALRQNKYIRITLAVAAYVLFFNLAGMSRAWVEQSVVAEIPGIWWVHGLLAGVLLLVLMEQKTTHFFTVIIGTKNKLFRFGA